MPSAECGALRKIIHTCPSSYTSSTNIYVCYIPYNKVICFHRRTMIPCSYPFVLMLYLTGMQCVPRFRQRFAALNAAASASSRVAQFTAAAHTPAHPGSIFIACVCVCANVQYGACHSTWCVCASAQYIAAQCMSHSTTCHTVYMVFILRRCQVLQCEDCMSTIGTRI